MIFAQDALALGVAAVAVAALGGFSSCPQSIRPGSRPGLWRGRSFLSTSGQPNTGGARGRFEVHLDPSEVIRVSASGGLAPGERVCIRGVQWGGVIEGVLVAMDRCFAR
jgi:hypothetical protein